MNWESFRKEVNDYEVKRVEQSMEAQIKVKKIVLDEVLKDMCWNAVITGLIACEVNVTNAPTKEELLPEFVLSVFSKPNSNFLKFLEIALYCNENMKKFEGK